MEEKANKLERIIRPIVEGQIRGFLKEHPVIVNAVDWYFDAGFNFSGFIPGRLLDTAGVAIARSNFSHDFSASQVADGSNPYSAETVVEATYKAQITPWWTVQPDFQYIFNPSGENGSHDATILGVRTSITF